MLSILRDGIALRSCQIVSGQNSLNPLFAKWPWSVSILVILDNGGLLMDMPSMRELGILSTGEGLDDSFADIRALTSSCQFANCSHNNEPGCAIRTAIETGALNPAHFQSYLKLKKEAEFNEMSYVDKRKKDKAFGKFIRSVQKQKGR